VEGLWPKRGAIGMDRQAGDDAGALRVPGREGSGGFVVVRDGRGSMALMVETVNEG